MPSQVKVLRELKVEDALLYLDQVKMVYDQCHQLPCWRFVIFDSCNHSSDHRPTNLGRRVSSHAHFKCNQLNNQHVQAFGDKPEIYNEFLDIMKVSFSLVARLISPPRISRLKR